MQLEISGSGPITPGFKECRETVLSLSVLRMEYGSASSARLPKHKVEICCWLLEITGGARFIRSTVCDFMRCPCPFQKVHRASVGVGINMFSKISKDGCGYLLFMACTGI